MTTGTVAKGSVWISALEPLDRDERWKSLTSLSGHSYLGDRFSNLELGSIDDRYVLAASAGFRTYKTCRM